MNTETNNPADQDTEEGFHLKAYRQMLASLFVATLASLVVIISIAIGLRYGGAQGNTTFLLAVAMFGVIGALFSALMRLYTFKELPQIIVNPKLEALSQKYLWIYSFTPIISGFIGAVIVYFAILSGYLSGEVFPDIACKADNGDCNSFLGLFKLGPNEAKDYAKALVVSFTAGFSERLVRDVLKNSDLKK